MLSFLLPPLEDPAVAAAAAAAVAVAVRVGLGGVVAVVAAVAKTLVVAALAVVEGMVVEGMVVEGTVGGMADLLSPKAATDRWRNEERANTRSFGTMQTHDSETKVIRKCVEMTDA